MPPDNEEKENGVDKQSHSLELSIDVLRDGELSKKYLQIRPL